MSASSWRTNRSSNTHAIVRAAVGLGLVLMLTFAGSASAQDVYLDLAVGIGGGNDDAGYGIAVDVSGNVYITGGFRGRVDFDTAAGTVDLTSTGSTGGADIFVQKLDASGNFVWARAMGGQSHDYGLGIAVDGAGNVYTTGFFSGTADFDPSAGVTNLTSVGSYDIFVQKLSSDGEFEWARSLTPNMKYC